MKCPECGFDNTEGSDRCENCMEPLRDLDVPRPKEGFQAKMMLDPVKKLLSGFPAAVSSTDSIAHAAEIMRQWRAGCVVVIDEGNLNGILSEVDLLFKMSSENRKVDELRVADFMTPKPVVLDEDSTIAYAINAMSVGGYRHLPVLREDQVVGIVSIKDVLRYLHEHL